MSALPSPTSAAEREKMVAAFVDGGIRYTDGTLASLTTGTVEKVRTTAERLVPAVAMPAPEEEVLGWCVVDRELDMRGGVRTTEAQARAIADSYASGCFHPYRVCRVVAVAPKPDPAPSGNIYRWEDGEVRVRRSVFSGPSGKESYTWVPMANVPVSDIPHVAALMGVKP